MEKLLYFLATIMIIIWAFLYFGYGLYNISIFRIFNVILVIVSFIILLKMIPKMKSKNIESDIKSQP